MIALASLLFVAAFGTVATAIGWPPVIALDRARTMSTAERSLIAFLIGSLLVHFAVWAVGSVRYDVASMSILAVIVAAAALPGLRAYPWRSLQCACGRGLEIARSDRWSALLLLIGAALVVNAMIGALAPPSDYDGLNYHLSLPKLDLERGFIGSGDVDPFGYMPALAEMIYRLALALIGPEAAQLIHALFGVATGVGSGLLVRRWGFGPSVSAGAAILFWSIHIVAWESGTTYVDMALAAFSVGALISYLAWRDAPTVSGMFVFGAMIGGAIGVKYHGFAVALAFGAVMLIELAKRPKLLGVMAVGPAVALLSTLPFLVRNYVAIGQPFYLLFDSRALWTYRLQWGVGRSPWNLLTVAWDLSVYPSRYFDGQQLGTPFLAAFAPLSVLSSRFAVRMWPVVVMLAAYAIQWFWLLSQQVRFLAPVLPIFAAFAAIGAAAAWSYVRDNLPARSAFLAVSGTLVGLQALIIGAHTVIRWPVALGLMEPMTYFTKVPSIQGSQYSTCQFISEHLHAGERFLFLVSLRSYYCPQAAMMRSLPQLESAELGRYLEAHHIKFIVVQTVTESRDNAEGEVHRDPVNTQLADTPLGRAIRAARPVFTDAFAITFDAAPVIASLRGSTAS